MSRWIPALLALAVGMLPAQDSKNQQPPPAKKQEDKALKKQRPEPPATQEEVPPEEDTSITVKEYSFNPLQAQKEVVTGNFYFKKGSYRAAAARFLEATRWNDGFPEAWLRLGEAEERLKDHKAARDAYTKYLAISPDAKNAAEIRKKLEKLK